MLTFIFSLLNGVFPQNSHVKFCAHFSSPIYSVICTGGNYTHIGEMRDSGSRFYRRRHSKGSINMWFKRAFICGQMMQLAVHF